MRFAWQTEDWRYVDTLGQEALDLARASGARLDLALACRAVGAARRARGQAEEAETLITEAEALLRTLDCRFELGRTLRELALLRRAQGRADDATRLLQEALTHFEALRALPDVERTRALM
jgi:tetratricopeptide (TPR) repeat protein